MRAKKHKTPINKKEWDKKFERLRDLQVDPISAICIINKHYYLCTGKIVDDEYFGV